MSGNHTPTPWAYDAESAAIYYDDGDVCPNIGWLNEENALDGQCVEDGLLIVTAVNSYASSQAQIERLRDSLERLIEAADSMGWATNSSAADEAISDARAALTGSKE